MVPELALGIGIQAAVRDGAAFTAHSPGPLDLVFLYPTPKDLTACPIDG
jgi:hypothetical protein